MDEHRGRNDIIGGMPRQDRPERERTGDFNTGMRGGESDRGPEQRAGGTIREEMRGGTQATGTMRDMGQRVRESETGREARELGREARQEGKELLGELQHYAEDFARDGKERITNRLHHISEALHRAADKLKEEDEPSTGRFADEAADRIDRIGGYLQGHNASDLVDEIDRFARRQPMVFIGSALLAGVLLGRFLRSSKRGYEHQRFDGGFEEDRFVRGGQQAAAVGEPRRVEVGAGAPTIGGTTGIPRGGGNIGGTTTGPTGPIGSRPLTEPPRPQERGGFGGEVNRPGGMGRGGPGGGV
jgi:hypothetical protein